MMLRVLTLFAFASAPMKAATNETATIGHTLILVVCMKVIVDIYT